MLTSVSEPSLGTVGTAGLISHASHTNFMGKKSLAERQRGQFLWQGRFKLITLVIVQAPWTIFWQTIIVLTVVYMFIVQLLLVYYFEDEYSFMWDVSICICESIYFIDIVINLLHAFWPLVRQNIRAYRRNCFLLLVDCLTMAPLEFIFKKSSNYYSIGVIWRWINVSRIYRMFTYFWHLNSMMHRSRKLLFLIEHAILVLLILHVGACTWYSSHRKPKTEKPWHAIGYPPHVGSELLRFDTYETCWYYSACRLFNVIFGDAFPVTSLDKWITSILMLIGCIFMRYRFIGLLAWDQIIESSRRLTFVERYHHMISYLEFHRAPKWLVEQACRYKQQLWYMKDGVLTSQHLHNLPLPLQMELIFDINVGLFHSTIVFRETSEAFMRQISLLMRHEIFMEGQRIWSQGIVKSGLLCIKRGTIEMLSDEDDDSPVIAFKEGTVLGELSLLYSIPAKVTVTAATYVEVQMLRRTDFMKAMSEQPATFLKIRNILDTRLKKTKARQKAIEKYDKGDSRLIRTRYRPMKVLKDHLAGVVDEDSTFTDDSHMYYRDDNNVRKPKFTTEYLELYVLAKNVTTVDFPRICLRSSFPWILEPNTSFTRMIDAIHLLLVLYSCIMCPYVAILALNINKLEQIFTAVVKTGLLLHIYLQLTTAIVQKSVKKTTVKEIAEVKMSTFGFYLDILSVFPVYIFSDTMDPEEESAGGQVARLCPILQFWHIWDYMKRWEQSFYSNAKFLCLMRYGIVIGMLSYWGGCFLYLYACPRKLCRKHSWMMQLIYWETKVFVTKDAKHESPTLTTLAFGTSVVVGAGSSAYAPGGTDLFVVSFLFIMGSYILCFYTAKLSSIYMLAHQRKQKFKESMRELFYFLSVNHMSHKIKARVKKFFCVQWYYNNAVSTQELFSHMSTNIQQEILSIEMVETLLECPLFQECSRDFLQTVAATSRTIVLPDNEVIQHAADISRDMYIVQKGHCNLVSHLGNVVSSIGPGSQFGAIEMLYGLPKVYTALTTTNCILLHIEYSALVQCLSTFPDVYHPIATVLEKDELKMMAIQFEEAKPLSGKFDTKINRIAHEIKESFVVMTGRHYRTYVKEFDKLGVMRHIRYGIMPGSITPHGLFLKCWCALRFLIALIYVVLVPYNIATGQHYFRSTYNWPDIFLYVDLAVMAYVAYYDDRSLLVTHPLLTISHYLKHGFLLDLMTVFPFDVMISFMNSRANEDLYRLNRMLQVFRITGAFHYWEGDIMRVNQAVVLLKFLPLALTVVNVATAFSFVATCTISLPPNSFFLYANCTSALLTNGAKQSYSVAVMEYIYTFYWVFEMFLGSGCTPDIVANATDTVMVMVLQIFGVLYFAFMFGYVASTRSSAAHALLEHREKTNDLRNFLYQENTEPMLTEKTLKYFEYVWKRTNGSNPQKICRCLNSALMEDTLVFMYERTLREVPLFGNVERSFIRVITQHLNEMYFLKGETVIQCRDIQPYIYIIYRGKVDVMSSYNEMITCMGPGGMFGNFTGQPIACSDVSIYASRSLDLLVIPSQTFFSLVKYYPKIQEPLNKAFETTKDYILPITMDIPSDGNSSDESETEKYSGDSAFDSRSASSRSDTGVGVLSVRSSQSNISSAKSGASVLTYQGMLAYNLFRPGSDVYQVFGYVTCIMAVLNYVFVLYNLVTINNCPIIFWFHASFDIYFYIKTYFTIHEGYANKHGDLIIDSQRCRRRYFRRKCQVYSDLFVNFPFEIFGFCFSKSLMRMHYLRINKLLRIKYLWEFYSKTSAELTNNLTILQTAMTFFVVILLLHTFTCVWLVMLIALTPVSMIRTLKTHLFVDQPPQQIWDYTTSFYVMTSELTSTGGDEFVIDDIYSLTLLMFCIISGKMLAAIVLATTMQLVHSCNHALTIYEKATTELIDLLKNQGLSSYQLNKFCVYVQQLWVTERGRQLPALLAQTPYVRRCDLMSAMFGHHLRGCYLFGDTGEPFLRQLTVVLDYTIFFPGNYIVVAGDSEARMYWVHSGTVSVVSVRLDLTETTHEFLGPGDMFGIMQGMNRGIAHCFSYRAETKVSILTLSLDSWIHILPFFPDAQRIVAERSDVMFAQI